MTPERLKEIRDFADEEKPVGICDRGWERDTDSSMYHEPGTGERYIGEQAMTFELHRDVLDCLTEIDRLTAQLAIALPALEHYKYVEYIECDDTTAEDALREIHATNP
jgi:hypothetical protein